MLDSYSTFYISTEDCRSMTLNWKTWKCLLPTWTIIICIKKSCPSNWELIDTQEQRFSSHGVLIWKYPTYLDRHMISSSTVFYELDNSLLAIKWHLFWIKQAALWLRSVLLLFQNSSFSLYLSIKQQKSKNAISIERY